MEDVLKPVSDESEIISAIKLSENVRLKSIAKKIVSIQRYAKGVEKETQSHKNLNIMFQDLCRMAVLSLTEIEDAVFEWTHPGKVASQTEENFIEEIGEKKLIRDLAKYVMFGSRIGFQYMENIGARGLPPPRRRDRISQALKQSQKGGSRKDDGEHKEHDGKNTKKKLLNSFCASHENIEMLRKEKFLLSSVSELHVLLHPWGLVPPDTTAIPRFTIEREKKQSSTPLPTMDICLSSDPVVFLQRWEAREAAVNGSLSFPRTSTHHSRKRRRSSPPRCHTPDKEGITTQENSTPFFPSLSCTALNTEVPPSVMRSIVHCGVSYLDLPL